MDVFKLFFEHDLRLEQVSGDINSRDELKRPSTLEEFMKPVQTYSRFYLTGTLFPTQEFGFDRLKHKEAVYQALDSALGNPNLYTPEIPRAGLPELIDSFQPGETYIVGLPDKPDIYNKLFDSELSLREKTPVLRNALDNELMVMFIEKAHHGVDIHLYSRKNVYESFFENFKPLLTHDFRFFSINFKRCRSERLFYFETWTLNRPPHGFEEVFSETVLR